MNTLLETFEELNKLNETKLHEATGSVGEDKLRCERCGSTDLLLLGDSTEGDPFYINGSSEVVDSFISRKDYWCKKCNSIISVREFTAYDARNINCGKSNVSLAVNDPDIVRFFKGAEAKVREYQRIIDDNDPDDISDPAVEHLYDLEDKYGEYGFLKDENTFDAIFNEIGCNPAYKPIIIKWFDGASYDDDYSYFTVMDFRYVELKNIAGRDLVIFSASGEGDSDISLDLSGQLNAQDSLIKTLGLDASNYGKIWWVVPGVNDEDLVKYFQRLER